MDSKREYDRIMRECLEYFRHDKIWEKVFSGFRDKYYSYGKFTGKVILKNPDADSIEVLEGFFGRSFHGRKSITISADKFGQALAASRFAGISPEKLLEGFFGEPLIGRQEKKLRRQQIRQEILQEFREAYRETPAGEQESALLQIVKLGDNRDPAEWKSELWFAAKVYNALPYRTEQRMYLAVFAAEVTGNPHAFDKGTAGGTLLYQLIQTDLEARSIVIRTSEIFPAYRRQKSYLTAGIMLDDISNYAMLCNVRAVKQDGSFHKGMEGFAEECSTVQVPLAVIAEWSEIRCVNNRILVVENPSVFAMLCADEDAKRNSYMCMNGQPRLAALTVLELLEKSGTDVYYAGDLDPEGLLIAQKLSQHYHGFFDFRHMSAADYERCRSEEPISQRRLGMLEKITDKRLLPAAEEIKKHKTAGYQEILFADAVFCDQMA